MSVNKVLIVDDSATDLLNLKNIIASQVNVILTATTGRESVLLAERESPDLIFMDIVMDDVDGYSACRQIMKNPDTKDIPVVFISSKRQKADKLWAQKQGGRALISKPYTKEQIMAQIQRY